MGQSLFIFGLFVEVNDAEVAAIVPNYSAADFGLAFRSIRGAEWDCCCDTGRVGQSYCRNAAGENSWNQAQETQAEKRTRSKKNKQQQKSIMRGEQELEGDKTRMLLNSLTPEQKSKTNRRNG